MVLARKQVNIIKFEVAKGRYSFQYLKNVSDFVYYYTLRIVFDENSKTYKFHPEEKGGKKLSKHYESENIFKKIKLLKRLDSFHWIESLD